MLLTALKEATHSRHQQIEVHLDLLNRDWTLPFYRRLLEGFHGFYRVVEPNLLNSEDWAGRGLDMSGRAKLPRLETDLRAMGLSAAQIDALPVCPQPPRCEDFPQRLGCLYVFEGSTLGGQVISRVLGQRLGLSPVSGASFFGGYGPETGAKWRAFKAFGQSQSLSPGETERAATAACACFDNLDCWLAQALGSNQDSGEPPL